MDPSLTQNQKSERQVGNYILEQKLGEGGMAEVWKARHQVLGTYVAIKFLSPGYAGIADVEQRFLGEGKKQARLSHPNIVSAYDFIYADGRSYLIMKFVEGESLDELLFRLQAPMPLPQVLAISTDVLHALQYAHSQNVVHRDIKPSNIMIEKNERALVLDFGVAMVVGEKRVTRVGMAIGTPHYMSPEQILGSADIDRRADIYSFGCVLYQMLTGKAPFEAAEGEDDTEFVIQDKHVRQQPVPPRQWNPYIPESIERVVLKCLEKKPADRFNTCQDLLTALTASPAAATAPTANTLIETTPESSKTLIETASTSPAPPKAPDPARPVRQTLVESSPRSAKTVIETGTPVAPTTPIASTPPPVEAAGAVSIPPQVTKPSIPVTPPAKPARDLTIVWVLSTALISATLVGGVYWYLHRPTPGPAPIVNPNPAPTPAPEPGPQVSKPSPGQIDVPKPEQPQPQPPVNPPVTKPDNPAPKAGPGKPADTTPTPPVSHTPAPDSNPTPTQPTPAPVTPPSPEPKVTPPPKHYAHEGDLVWSGQVDKNQVIQISASGANIGSISGDQFPGDGVPIQVSINSDKFAVVSQPNPLNQFSQIWLRSTMKGNVVVVIHWKVLPNE
jgi:serine/threonine protein kinase